MAYKGYKQMTKQDDGTLRDWYTDRVYNLGDVLDINPEDPRDEFAAEMGGFSSVASEDEVIDYLLGISLGDSEDDVEYNYTDWRDKPGQVIVEVENEGDVPEHYGTNLGAPEYYAHPQKIARVVRDLTPEMYEQRYNKWLEDRAAAEALKQPGGK